MVAAVRRGASQRAVAREFGVGLGTVQRWLARAGDERLDRVDFMARASRPRRTTRIPIGLEDLILEIREALRAESALGEYGARAIERELVVRAEQGEIDAVPALRTIGRVIERRGAVERRRRVRRPAPPPGWYLPLVVARRVELDSFDVIEELRLKGGPVFDILTGVSVHGGIEAAWPGLHVTARTTVDALAGHWRSHGLPGYAQFDNDTRFAGVHGFADRLGQVVRFCLASGVVPVFAPVRESGFQNAIESYNARWKAKVWRRFFFPALDDVVAASERYVAASRARLAPRIEAAPSRRPIADGPSTPASTIVYLRRTDGEGATRLLGQAIEVDPGWPHRLVRVEVDFAERFIRCFALRRRAPGEQPLLRELPLAGRVGRSW
jgi:transposase-like protein